MRCGCPTRIWVHSTSSVSTSSTIVVVVLSSWPARDNPAKKSPIFTV